MNFIEFLAKLDWLERVDALARALLGQRSHRFAIDRWAGWTGQEVEDLLEANGVEIWDRAFDQERLYFRVKQRQARWAEYVMMRNSAPVVGTPVDPRNLNAPRIGGPRIPEERRPGLLDLLFDVLYNLGQG
jgi:hypothetical protein